MSDHLNGSLVFADAAPIEIPVQIGARHFILKEADEAAAVKYQNAASKGAKRLSDGSIIMPDRANDAEPLLVSCCLIEIVGIDGDKKYLPVSLPQVMAMPTRIVRALADKVKAMSHLNITGDEAKDAAKNSPEATLATST